MSINNYNNSDYANESEENINSEDFEDENKKEILEKIENVISVEQKNIDFELAYTGKIDEMDLTIENNSETIGSILRIRLICLNKEFDELEEYVYSMRKVINNINLNSVDNIELDYNDSYLLKIDPKVKVEFKVAIKVPSIKDEKLIKGIIEIKSSNLSGYYYIPITTKVLVPKIKIDKMMKDGMLKLNVLKILMKNRYKLEYRAIIKSDFPDQIKVEYDFIPDNNIKNIYEFKIWNKNSILNKYQNNLIIFTIKLKQINNSDYKNLNELKALLLVKIKNSTIVFGFPLFCQIVEDINEQPFN